jgi:hypothetical protein
LDSIKPVKAKFKLENQLIEEDIVQSWTIGKIKGVIRKKFQINIYHQLQLLYQGHVLENMKKFKDIQYSPGTIIKVMASRPSKL